MSKATDQQYLRNEAYKDDGNLNARMTLHERFGTNKIGWHPWVFDQLDLPESADILELGCGPGALWVQNASRIPPGWNITLSDLSDGMLNQAQANLATVGHAFVFSHFDAQAIPYAESSFDAVIANHMLYHVPDRPKTYAEVSRILRPGGRFIAATNSRDSMVKLDEIRLAVNIQTGLRFCHDAENFFWLENGAGELKEWFKEVTLRQLTDTNVVTETQPLIDYILSGPARDEIVGDTLERLRRYIDDEITDEGAVRIEKTTGLFIATK
jgi:ubiquinone/menaquinone biosynthesis C-methylase UbiE